jgi:DNA-binding winged helix-turn-helix (wHTH) protein
MNSENGSLREFGKFRLDTAKKILWHDEQIVSLPLKSVELLCVLLENQGEVVTKKVLMEQVWGEAFVEESVLTQNIYLLRKTLRDLGGETNLIKTLPRRGYIFRREERNGTEGTGAELVVERHLFERIHLEETTEPESSEAATIETTAQPVSLPGIKPRAARRAPRLPSGVGGAVARGLRSVLLLSQHRPPGGFLGGEETQRRDTTHTRHVVFGYEISGGLAAENS